MEIEIENNILKISGSLENELVEWMRLSKVLGDAKERGGKLTIDTEDLRMDEEALKMWFKLAEGFLLEMEVHYLASDLSMLLGCNESYLKAFPEHTFDLGPPVVKRTAEPDIQVW